MLILKRKKNESILIGNDIRITILECSSGEVRLAINAPRQLSILREELSEMEQSNKDASMPDMQSLQASAAALLPYLRKD
ncbi:MAG: carbon storage regulator [Clostridium sp.]